MTDRIPVGADGLTDDERQMLPRIAKLINEELLRRAVQAEAQLEDAERLVRETIANEQQAYADRWDSTEPELLAILHCVDIARGGAA